MKLKFLSESELISAVRKDFSDKTHDLILGIGDDAAVVRVGGRQLIVTKDLLVEDYHFRASFNPPYYLGRKSLSVNLSDMAAMGGRPKYALLGLALPESRGKEWVEDYFSGFKAVAEETGVVLIGGDVSEAKKITVSVTLIGEGRNILTRSGARPGDSLFVSGTLGDAKQGLLLLQKGYKLGKDKRADPLLRAFLDPVPLISLGTDLSRFRLASSTIDVSDGLSVDLVHLCEESGCGAEIRLERLPLSPELRFWQRKAFDFALHGGEDFQLLFSIPREKINSLSRLQRKYRIASIGRMIKGKGIYVIDQRGKKKALQQKGYQHFKIKGN